MELSEKLVSSWFSWFPTDGFPQEIQENRRLHQEAHWRRMAREEEGAGQQGQEVQREGVAADADLLSSRVVGLLVKPLGP